MVYLSGTSSCPNWNGTEASGLLNNMNDFFFLKKIEEKKKEPAKSQVQQARSSFYGNGQLPLPSLITTGL